MEDGSGLVKMLTGLALMGMALVALPALMKLVAPMVSQTGGGGGAAMAMAEGPLQVAERRLQPAQWASAIRNYCVSPNGQFVAVETTGADSVPDGYPGGGAFTNTLTLLVEISSGRMVASLGGGSSDWCRN